MAMKRLEVPAQKHRGKRGELTFIQSADQVGFVDMRAPANIHEVGTPLHFSKGTGIQYPTSVTSQGQ
jgi:hypothetical protein